MEGRPESAARNPAQRVELCFLRLWFSVCDHWLARKIDFLVRVSRRVPEVPRCVHCRSAVRRLGWRCKGAGARLRDGARGNPSRARRQTPRVVRSSSRHRPSELSVATVNQATTPGGTAGRLRPKGSEATFRNGSQCPLCVCSGG